MLAMRATFSPCSASGIAQPRMTSSISDAFTPCARFTASRMTVAASSSGRVFRSAPAGALPTGVRTADTMRASPIEILQQIFDGVANFACLAVEKMIGAVDHDKLLRFVQQRVEPSDFLQRNQLVAFAVDDERGLGGR